MFRKKSLIGLDIGRSNVHLAAIEPRTNSCYVTRGGILPDQVSKDSNLPIEGRRQRIAALITDLTEDLPIRGRDVVVCIQGDHALGGYLEFPYLSEKELAVAVPSAVARELPFDMADTEITAVSVEALRPGKSAVFYSAWRTEAVEELRRTLTLADFRMQRLELTGLALAREVHRNRDLDPMGLYVLLHVGYEDTQLVIVRGGFPYYLRDIPLAGREFTYAIQVGSQTSWADAEALKCQYPLEELMYALKPRLEEWRHEIARTLNYFRRRFSDQPYSEVFFSGGTALLRDLADWLAIELEVPVTVDDWDRLTSDDSTGEAPFYKPALGLAMGR